jgi:hypothetical protein
MSRWCQNGRMTRCLALSPWRLSAFAFTLLLPIATRSAAYHRPIQQPDQGSANELFSQPLHQIDNPAAQGIGQDLQRLECDVRFAALDLADVRAMQPRTVGEHVLRPALLLPQCLHRGPDLLLDLHQEEFGVMLVLSILVITSRLLSQPGTGFPRKTAIGFAVSNPASRNSQITPLGSLLLFAGQNWPVYRSGKGRRGMAHELLIEDGEAAMFYVGARPWHGLGTRLANPATAEEGKEWGWSR